MELISKIGSSLKTLIICFVVTETVHSFAMCLNMKSSLEKSGESQSWNWRRLFDKPDRLNSTNSLSAGI